ncbi:MAG: hypothetical protein LCH36_06250 [Actinobacteria bacterium]|nr:hypothetical protein [Actinomycetota bacterium]
MNEIMLDIYAATRMSNDAGRTAEGLRDRPAPNCAAGGSEAVATVAAMVAEDYLRDMSVTRSLLCENAIEALAAINELWSDDQHFAATFKQFSL